MIAVGAYLQERRRTAGLTQEDVARRLNITARTVSEWERGKNDPGSEVLARLIELIGATPEEVHQLMLDPHADAEVGRRLAIMPQGSEINDAELDAIMDDIKAELRAGEQVKTLFRQFLNVVRGARSGEKTPRG